MPLKPLLNYSLAALWMLVIFLFSHQPAGKSDTQSGFFVSLLAPVVPVQDGDLLTFIVRKAAHFTLYCILGVLIYSAVRHHTPTKKQAVAISIGAVLSYALLDEFHQLFVPGRSGEVRDVLIDTVAGSIGVAFFSLLPKRSKKSI